MYNSQRHLKNFHLLSVAKSGAGFTLIELLIYVSLFTLIIGGGLLAVFQIVQGSAALHAKSVLSDEGNFVLAKINFALTGVKTINSATGASALSVTKYDNTLPNPTTITLDNTVIQSNSTGTFLPLTSANVSVTSLQFTHITLPQEGVAASVTLSTKGENGRTYNQTFDMTKYVRK